jgi:hypothetical protein
MNTAKSPNSGFRKARAILFSLLTIAAPLHALAATTSEEVQRFHEWTTATDDWSGTAMFDLERSVSVKARLTALHIPEGHGYVVIEFTVSSPRVPETHTYRSIIASKAQWQRQRPTQADFRIGQELILHGWPQTEANTFDSMMLTGEILIPASGKRLSFLQPNRRKSAADSKEQDHPVN